MFRPAVPGLGVRARFLAFATASKATIVFCVYFNFSAWGSGCGILVKGYLFLVRRSLGVFFFFFFRCIASWGLNGQTTLLQLLARSPGLLVIILTLMAVRLVCSATSLQPKHDFLFIVCKKMSHHLTFLSTFFSNLSHEALKDLIKWEDFFTWCNSIFNWSPEVTKTAAWWGHTDG